MLSIGEFSKICQVSTKTLRYYAEIGLILPDEINLENGYRYYSIDQLETMLFINRLKSYNFSLEEIKEILETEEAQDEKLCKALMKKKKEIDLKIQNYQNSLAQLHEDITTLQQGKSIMSYLDKIDVQLVEIPPMNLLNIRKMIQEDEFAEAYSNSFGQLFREIMTDKLTVTAPPMVLFHSSEFTLQGLDTEFAIPVQESGILGEKTLLGHCIYINEHEMDLIKETNTMVVHNPESNMGNACGCPPTMHIVHKGILTGLGTDGYTHDMTESYKVANVLHKHHLCDANAAWGEVPQMLFEGNAKIANRYFKQELGVLKEGAAGDVIIVDYNPLTPLHAGNINSHIVFGMTGRDVVTTVANGKVLMKDRELLHIDADKVMADCRQAAKELADRINA